MQWLFIWPTSWRDMLSLSPHDPAGFLESILESSTVYSIIGLDLNGGIVFWNEGARLLYGHEADAVVGKRSSSLLSIPPEDLNGEPSRILQSSLLTGRWEGSVTRLRSSGEQCSVQVVTTPRYDAQRVAVGYVEISKDISGEIRLLDEVIASQIYTRSLIESNADALVMADAQGTVIDVNAQMEALTGRLREHIIGQPFHASFSDPELADNGIHEVLKNRRVKDYELTAINVNGDHTAVSYNASLIQNEAGLILGVLGTLRDITRQKTLETRLRDQQFYARSLIEASMDALVTIDPLGIITDINHGTELLTGYSREEMVGTPFSSYFSDPSSASDAIAQVLLNSNLADFELTVNGKEGSRTTVSYNAARFYDRAGGLQGVLAVARDVTALKHSERRLEKASRTKSEFLSHMSHELRTPLHGIIGFAEFLLDQTPGPLNDRQVEYLGDILSCGNHLLLLVNDVLDLSKVEAGKMELRPELFFVGDAIHDVIAVVNAIAPEKRIRVRSTGSGPMQVYLDQQKFKQILYNLLSNAVKFTGESGLVEVEVQIRLHDRFALIVRDSGSGMSEKSQKQLFEKFQQLGTDAATRQPGTGLGLVLTKQLVELQGGRISVTSKPSHGSVFCVELPRRGIVEDVDLHSRNDE